MTRDLERIDICIRFNGQRYITSQRQGLRATSIHSAHIAAVRLGCKLFGDRFEHAQPWLDLDPGADRQQWSLQALPVHPYKKPKPQHSK
ncbi:hypothetical protein E9531_17070 [Lampropedia puyangensis]|uniref:Uncharacterized protein n=1 Tax=Lampropedia puyangensis TaxID=1330072 RepID=A0A4S8ELL6_9BURK|nr:hypothetical protein [Lampropedia puyangensis]THT95549.1 hypothetical protein E9531_17070 [Lampropedia puyangensis]